MAAMLQHARRLSLCPPQSPLCALLAARASTTEAIPATPVTAQQPESTPSPLAGPHTVRTDWTREEVTRLFNQPLLELVHTAAQVHRQYNDPRQVQRCTLLSIKTGGCPETCTYCAQSSAWRKSTGLKAERLMDPDEVYAAAVRAKAAGSTRFCMGAAWRGPSQVGAGQWQRVLDMVRRVRGLGMEVCTTLGMLTPEQAQQLRAAGLTAYNHNLDTSPEYYSTITSSRNYQDRLDTLGHVRGAGISVCAGGIIGMGEATGDRVGLLHQLATLPEHPESVPINALVAVKGTPLGEREPPSALEVVRCIAAARVLMPRSVVRLSAGRLSFSTGDQALMFLAGANSIFDGDKLLTTPNNERSEDLQLFDALGLATRPAFLHESSASDGSAPSTQGAASMHSVPADAHSVHSVPCRSEGEHRQQQQVAAGLGMAEGEGEQQGEEKLRAVA